MFKRVQKCVRLSTTLEIVPHMLYLAIAEIGKTAPVAQLDGRPTGNQELIVGLTLPRWQHSFVETDHEIFSTVILFIQLSVSGKRMCKILVNCLED